MIQLSLKRRLPAFPVPSAQPHQSAFLAVVFLLPAEGLPHVNAGIDFSPRLVTALNLVDHYFDCGRFLFVQKGESLLGHCGEPPRLQIVGHCCDLALGKRLPHVGHDLLEKFRGAGLRPLLRAVALLPGHEHVVLGL